jgi:GNAT superfamily N-acetyltransferase
MAVEVQIRPLTGDDISAVVQLSVLAWEPVFSSFAQILGPAIYPIVYPDWRRQQAEAVEGVLKDSAKYTVWVAEVGGAVVGFIAYVLNSDEKTGEVDLLAVHPDYQNQDIGTDLNNFALGKMREAGMRLAVVGTGGDPGHAPARRSYEKAGYTGLPLVRYYKDL